jgi:DNA-binding PadR family transcriptional regulator
MYSKELLKGTLSTIILKLLDEKGRMYGYQITQLVKELSDEKILLKEGSLYPSLHKLRDDGLIVVETENIGKRVRHYYSLTPKGSASKKEKEAELKDFMNTIGRIITPQVPSYE